MFDKHIYIHEDRSEQAARIVNRGLEKFGDKLQSISQDDIKAHDRVDITLKEYDELRNNVRQYEERCRKMGSMIMQMGIPYEVIKHIIHGSISVTTDVNHCDFKRRYRVEFDVEDSPYVPK